MSDKNIYQALDEARTEFPPIVKNRVNPHFKNRYADLEAVLRGVEPVLRGHGLGLFQTVTSHGCGHGLVTSLILVNEPGDALRGRQSMECTIPLPADADPQKFGSAITYARRYGIVTLLGLVTEDDDDANAAAPRQAPEIPTSTPRDRQKARKGPSEAAGAPQSPDLDRSAGWESPAVRAAEHERLVERISGLSPEQQDELRKLSVDLGGFPLPKDKFDELERAVGLVGGTI